LVTVVKSGRKEYGPSTEDPNANERTRYRRRVGAATDDDDDDDDDGG